MPTSKTCGVETGRDRGDAGRSGSRSPLQPEAGSDKRHRGEIPRRRHRPGQPTPGLAGLTPARLRLWQSYCQLFANSTKAFASTTLEPKRLMPNTPTEPVGRPPLLKSGTPVTSSTSSPLRCTM